MKRRFLAPLHLLLGASLALCGEPTPAAVSAFNSYVKSIDARIDKQHRSAETFLAGPASDSEADRLKNGEVIIERLTPPASGEFPGAMLHHWRGSAFVRGATAADFERLLLDIPSFPKIFAPQLLKASLLEQDGNHRKTSMRVRQQHVITVVMDSTYEVTFGRLDARHGYSASRSVRIDEIDSPGTSRERALSKTEEHGFLWRLDTWWSYEEKDGGVMAQIESVSLTRDIPRLLGWMIRPFVESVPRETVEFTLRSACGAAVNKGKL
jgi:hypothetical protein